MFSSVNFMYNVNNKLFYPRTVILMELKAFEHDKPALYPTLRQYLACPATNASPFARMLKGPFSKAAVASMITLLMSGCGQQTSGVPAGPRYLTETEALQIFTDEAKKAGITFSTDTEKIIEVKIPDDIKTEGGEDTLKIRLDGYNAEKDAGFEFINYGDGDFTGIDNKFSPDVVADSLNNAGGNENGTKVYYLPPVDADSSVQAAENANVKEEINAFVEWLKSQGLI